MITHFIGAENSSLKEMTRSRGNLSGLDPLRAFENFQAFECSKFGKSQGNSMRGSVWEACLYDAIISYGVSPSDIRKGVNVTGKREMKDKKKLRKEIDYYLISSNVCIHSKTSVRERCSQVDLAAYFLEIKLKFGGGSFGLFDDKYPPDHYLVIYKEYPEFTSERSREHASDLQGQCVSDRLKVISSQDPVEMTEFIARIRQETKCRRSQFTTNGMLL